MGFFSLFSKNKKKGLPLETVIAYDKGDLSAKRLVQEEFDKGMTNEDFNNLRWQAYGIPANQGDAFAQYWLGFLYSTISRDVERAVYWYELSAKQGNIDAMRDLSFGYSEFLNTTNLGYGPVPFGHNESLEIYWLKMAAEHGDEKSKSELADRGVF